MPKHRPPALRRFALVSIVLPTFNRLQYLPEAVESIFQQTFQDWELLIADDGSDAATRTFLQSINDPPRVRVIYLSHSGRPAVARNAALRQAEGEYVAFMDSDDVWMPDKLETQIASLRAHGDCAWSQTRFLLADIDGISRREMPVANGWILGQLLRTETVIALPSVVATRSLLQRIGGFDEDLVMCEDYDLWLRLAAASPIDAVDRTLTIVRRHGQHYGDSATAFRDSIHVHDKILRSGVAARYESVIHKERAKNSASLARCHAASGKRIKALRTLVWSAPASWRHSGWWSEATMAIAMALTPPPIVRAFLKHRSGSRRS